MVGIQTEQAQQTMQLGREPAAHTQRAPVPPNWATRRRFWVVPLVLLGALVPLAIGWKTLMGNSSQNTEALVLFTIRRGDLPITVTERGNLESQNTEQVICDVENLGGDRSGVTGTQILFIVPNGAEVKKGDLLVELDSAPLQERLDSQFLALQRAEAEKLQANSKYDNQVTQNLTNLAEAELKVELAKLDCESYEDEEGGTFKIELQNIEMEVQTARAQQLILKGERDAIEELHKLGYKSKSDLETARLDLLKANSNLASQLAKARQLRDYIYHMEKLNRQGQLDTAVRSLEQVKRNNESELAQAEAARDSANRAYDKEKERYERYQEQLEKCKIYAPQSGMVAYAMEDGRRGGGSMIEEGAFVRQRQQILTIPDLSSMQVSTAVHESVLDQVTAGLKTVIRVDAFPDRSYRGSVKSVAVLPDQGGWLSSDTKVYKTIVTIDQEVTQLKPGMTAVVEIDIETLQDVISIPIQAVVQRGSANWCYVKTKDGVTRREIKLGKTNDKFVQILAGLAEGDTIVLNPMSLVEEAERQERDAKKKDEEEAVEEGNVESADAKDPRQKPQPAGPGVPPADSPAESSDTEQADPASSNGDPDAGGPSWRDKDAGQTPGERSKLGGGFGGKMGDGGGGQFRGKRPPSAGQSGESSDAG